LLLLAGFLPWELKVVGDFTIRPGATVVTSPQVGGTLSAIFVDEGSRVKQGDVLAELQNLEVSHAYEETRGELASRKAELDLLMAGNRPEEIERARKVVETKKADLANAGRVEEQREMLRSTVAKREAELAHARTTFESSSALLAQGLIPRNDLDRDRTAFEVAQKAHAEALGALKVLDEMTLGAKELKAKELAQAQSELNIQLAGSRKESIRAVEAEVAKLEEQLKILQEQIDLLKIRSPIQGQVATPYLKNRLGAFLEQGKPFCQIVDTSLVIVDMPVAEKEIADVALGNPIILKLRPFPMRTFEANVKAISPVADEASEERKVVIRGELPNPDGSLKTGMTGVGKILCGKRLIINLVSRRLIRWLRTEFWEYLP
jgi:HlyD family secretion protein